MAGNTNFYHGPGGGAADGFTDPTSTNVWTAQQTFSTGINLTGGQIIFPAVQVASADANTFDDYEEGTWTPSIADATLSASESQTYTNRVGIYTKSGRVVNFSCHVFVSDLGTLTAGETANIIGLPFTAQATANLNWMLPAYGDQLAIAAGTAVVGIVAQNTTYLTLVLWDAATGVTGLLISEVSADGIIRVTGHYEV